MLTLAAKLQPLSVGSWLKLRGRGLLSRAETARRSSEPAAGTQSISSSVCQCSAQVTPVAPKIFRGEDVDVDVGEKRKKTVTAWFDEKKCSYGIHSFFLSSDEEKRQVIRMNRSMEFFCKHFINIKSGSDCGVSGSARIYLIFVQCKSNLPSTLLKNYHKHSLHSN